MSSTLTLDAINPKHGAKFSPNLYKWLKGVLQSKPLFYQIDNLRVYKDAEGCLYVGFMRAEEGGWLYGHQMYTVLGRGSRKSCLRLFAIQAANMKPVKNFWQDYVKHGRCAIDKQHARGFIGDETRWLIKGKDRSCQWCGKAKQKLIKRKEVIIHDDWVNC
jgi:hypothetical protein